MVPLASTARRFTTVPSYTPLLPPTSTSSSMITGSAPTGSSTPPICAAAEMWQFLPIWAQLPTSACESTMVPSPTHAPALMYIGGMQVTLLPMKHPSRGFVKKRLTGRVHRHVHDTAHAKPQQYPFLDPRVDTPAGFRGGVRIG